MNLTNSRTLVQKSVSVPLALHSSGDIKVVAVRAMDTCTEEWFLRPQRPKGKWVLTFAREVLVCFFPTRGAIQVCPHKAPKE